MAVNKQKFDSDFLVKELSNVWLGRINKDSDRDCTVVFAKFPSLDPNKIYSFTTTCQNWTVGQDVVSGYPPATGQTPNYPKCYNAQGLKVNAVSLSGLSTGIAGTENAQYFSPGLGKTCNSQQKLICVKQ